MRERLRWLLAVYDWLARIHFALFTLGGLGLIGGVTAHVLDAPLGVLLSGTIGGLALVLGLIGWFRSRYIETDRERFWRRRWATMAALVDYALEETEKRPSQAKPRSRGRSKRDQ